MIKYKTFLTVFIIAIVASIIFMLFYIQAIFGVVVTVTDLPPGEAPNPLGIVSKIFSPAVIISALIAGLSSLAYRILGIVGVVKNKLISDGEKALWIIGFLVLGFVTAIVFLVMAKGKKFAE